MMTTAMIPVKINDARHMPRELLFPGQVSLYRYVGFSTGITIRRPSERLLKTGTQETYRKAWIRTRMKSVYAVNI